MCMYSTRQHPLVAKQDIVCVKYLKKTTGGELRTPFQAVPVPIGKPFTPSREDVEFDRGSMTYSLSGGVIHAMTQVVDWNDARPYKAIIPKGTEYWVDVRGRAIAAKKMIISDEPIDIQQPDESLLKDIMSNVPSEGELSVGDYYIKDKGFISPFEVTEDIIPQIAGVIVGFKDKEPLIWSGEVARDLPMDTEWNSKFDKYVSEPEKDFDGEKHLEAFLENYKKFDKNRFRAYAACIAYKPEVGKWYIPALGEKNIMIENLMFVHAAAWISKSNIFLPTGYYWTSSEYGAGDCWDVYVGYDDAGRDWDYRGDRYHVCFFLASTNNVAKVKINRLTAEKEETSVIKKSIKAVKKYVRRRKA